MRRPTRLLPRRNKEVAWCVEGERESGMIHRGLRSTRKC